MIKKKLKSQEMVAYPLRLPAYLKKWLEKTKPERTSLNNTIILILEEKYNDKR